MNQSMLYADYRKNKSKSLNSSINKFYEKQACKFKQDKKQFIMNQAILQAGNETNKSLDLVLNLNGDAIVLSTMKAIIKQK